MINNRKKYNLPVVTSAEFNLMPERYELRNGNLPDAPPCPYGNSYKWIGYDKENRRYVKVTKSVFKKLIGNLILFMICTFIFVNVLSAQHEEAPHSSEKHAGIIEVISSGIYSYYFEHSEGIFGTEIHLTYWKTLKWGGGLSYTSKFEEKETLHDVALIGSMNPTHWMTLNLGVNFALPAEHRKFLPGAYAETEVNIRPVEWFHFGPVLGTVIGKEIEATVGFHLGFEF